MFPGVSYSLDGLLITLDLRGRYLIVSVEPPVVYFAYEV